ncbi:MAG: hypothetical protein KA035_03155 [Candidatus Levybacteria bacterium]|nr:hypothetical protein [Candidatus Levybacteria bacterium]
MPSESELFKRFDSGRNITPVEFKYNQPFYVSPRFSTHTRYEVGPYDSNRSGVIDVPLLGEGDNKGFVKFKEVNEDMVLKQGESIQMPLGVPLIEFKLDASTGKMIPQHLPVEIGFGVGPATAEEIKSGDMRVVMELPTGIKFLSINTDYFFDPNGARRMLHTDGWISAQTGLRGPVLFPSGADFDRFKFTIVRE